MSKTDEEFARFMNLLRWRYDRQVREHDVDPTGIWRFSPSSDEQFLEQMEEVAPIIIERWMRYLTEKGNLTLDQAFFDKGIYAQRRARQAVSADRESAFLHWLVLERRAKRAGSSAPNLSELSRRYDEESWEDNLREYRRFKSRIKGLPPIPDK